MAEHVASIGIDVIGSILAEYAKRIVDKALKGEKLSDWEVGFLLMEATRRTLESRMDAIEKRMSSLEESLKTRIEAVEKRVEALEKRVEAVEKRVDSVEKELLARVDSVERGLLAKIDSVEKGLSAKIDSLSMRIDLIEKRIVELGEEFKSLRGDVDKKISDLRTDFDKKILEVKEDTKYIKHSLDQLRDNVINTLARRLVELSERRSSV
jgi:chaperonin cofactor prefoldin